MQLDSFCNCLRLLVNFAAHGVSKFAGQSVRIRASWIHDDCGESKSFVPFGANQPSCTQIRPFPQSHRLTAFRNELVRLELRGMRQRLLKGINARQYHCTLKPEFGRRNSDLCLWASCVSYCCLVPTKKSMLPPTGIPSPVFEMEFA